MIDQSVLTGAFGDAVGVRKQPDMAAARLFGLAAGGVRAVSISLRTVGAGSSAVDRNGEAAAYLDIIAGIRRGDRRNKLACDPGILNPAG
jgi:hypothetical protein